MRVAIAADGGQVSPHFGRCERYVLVDIADAQAVNREDLANPGHEPGRLPQVLHEGGVGCIVAGGMGPRALALFAQLGIQTISGVQGPIDVVIEKLASGELDSGESTCHH